MNGIKKNPVGRHSRKTIVGYLAGTRGLKNGGAGVVSSNCGGHALQIDTFDDRLRVYRHHDSAAEPMILDPYR